jgi:hypothetical protein
MPANPTLHWTGPAERSSKFEGLVVAGPASECQSVMRRMELLISCLLVLLGVWALVVGADDAIHFYVAWGPEITVLPAVKQRIWLHLVLGWTSMVIAGLLYWYAPASRRRRATPGGFPVLPEDHGRHQP